MRLSTIFLILLFIAWLRAAGQIAAGGELPETVDFDRHIRPLLSDNCFQCHGPDERQRQADLRLDVQAALEDRERGVIVPGQPAASSLYERITAAEPDERMPPPESKRSLTPDQIELIRRWIEAGAHWREHWAFVAPRRAPLPAVAGSAWNRNAIDPFVLGKLLDAGLRGAAAEADKRTLLRRVTMDITGLPPTPEETAAFLADPAPNAYERLIDRLLASPAYGERMASAWLEGARFADTSGYQNDGPRDMWRWRDWVIDAYNRGKPFDQFTIEQIAGDLLPAATLDQHVATGFNRNHRGNAEGGIIPEEYQVEYVVDRVETTATVWMGLTLGCARCHDHKFDPISQREFYQIYAFFNNIPEHGRAIKEGNSPPFIAAPSAHQRQALDRLDSALADAERKFAGLESQIEGAIADHIDQAEESQPPLTIATDLVARFPLEATRDAEGHGSPPHQSTVVPRGEVTFAAGRLGEAAVLDGGPFLDAGDVAGFGYFDRFTVTAWVNPAQSSGTILSKMTDELQGDGYALQLERGHLQVNLVKRWLDDSIRVATVETVPTGQWTHIAVTYDGSRVARGIQVYLDGEPAEMSINLDALNQSFSANQPLRIGGGGGAAGRFRGRIDEVRIYHEALPHGDIRIVATPASVTEIAALPANRRTPAQAAKLRRHYLEHWAGGELAHIYGRVVRLRKERAELVRSFPTVMVMREMKTPRATHLLARGEYDKPGERVWPAFPARIIGSPPAEPPRNRLDFANWLIAADHPLTARVAVNRHWQLLFGQGLVNTAEDFGIQGERPSHPKLLDWLAVEFRESGWDVKALQRRLVTSATYRQSSLVDRALLARDPDNRLLGRGPRYRFSAEMVRDQTLAASGLLVTQLGGPSVKPYQPADLWKDIATDKDYQQDEGAGLYRRSLYTYWKRTVSPPSMAVFDASTRETCRVRGPRTNTPLQALTLLNDVTFVEAARVLAERVMGAAAGQEARLRLAFQRVLARSPDEPELRILTAALASHLKQFRRQPERAEQLLNVGESPRVSGFASDEVAAYATVASMLLNLDEAVTKQ